eukprot:449137_1
MHCVKDGRRPKEKCWGCSVYAEQEVMDPPFPTLTVTWKEDVRPSAPAQLHVGTDSESTEIISQRESDGATESSKTVISSTAVMYNVFPATPGTKARRERILKTDWTREYASGDFESAACERTRSMDALARRLDSVALEMEKEEAGVPPSVRSATDDQGQRTNSESAGVSRVSVSPRKQQSGKPRKQCPRVPPPVIRAFSVLVSALLAAELTAYLSLIGRLSGEAAHRPVWVAMSVFVGLPYAVTVVALATSFAFWLQREEHYHTYVEQAGHTLWWLIPYFIVGPLVMFMHDVVAWILLILLNFRKCNPKLQPIFEGDAGLWLGVYTTVRIVAQAFLGSLPQIMIPAYTLTQPSLAYLNTHIYVALSLSLVTMTIVYFHQGQFDPGSKSGTPRYPRRGNESRCHSLTFERIRQ